MVFANNILSAFHFFSSCSIMFPEKLVVENSDGRTGVDCNDRIHEQMLGFLQNRMSRVQVLLLLEQEAQKINVSGLL